MFVDITKYITIWISKSQLHDAQETRSLAIWVTTPFIMSIAAFCVCVRLYSRIFIRRYFGIDDFMIICALVFSVIVNASVTVGAKRYGWDHHVWDIEPQYYESSLKLVYFIDIAWGMASSCVRLSAICLYYRLAKAIQAPPKAFLVLHATFIFNFALTIFYVFNGIFPCTPIRNFWAWPSIKGSHCINEALVIQVIAVLNTFSEFQLATLPLVAAFKLGVDRAQRSSVVCLLCLGYLVGVIGCFRTYYTWKVLSGDFDVTWWALPQYVSSEFEIDVAIICACAAPIRPLARYIHRQFQRLRASQPKILGAVTTWTGKTITQTTEPEPARDCEAVAEWHAILRRAIDIEGIATDGYAYTVTISGPQRPQKSILERLGFKQKEVQELPGYLKTDGGKAGMEISQKTEVTVQSSWPHRSSKAGSGRWSHDMDYIEMYASPDIITAQESSTHDDVAILQQNARKSYGPGGTFFDDTRSEEGIEALPVIPSPAAQSRPSLPSGRFSSIRGLSLFPRLTER